MRGPWPRPGAARRASARWRRRGTLRSRLAVLVTGAVAVAVLGFALVSWASVHVIIDRQLESQLVTSAQTIAGRPDQWRSAPARPPQEDGGGAGGAGGEHGHGHGHDLGTRWQLLTAKAEVDGESSDPLPVTAGARAVAEGRSERVEEQVVLAGDAYRMMTVPLEGGGAVQVAVSEHFTGRILTAFALLLLFGGALGVAAAALLGWAVARAGLTPVRELTEAVEEVAVTMDLGRPIPAAGYDEIARLARSVNTMLAALDTARRAQRMLVEDAGHELRTPLTSIRTNIELLLAVERRPELAHRLPPEERAQLLCDLDAQIVELTTLTAELVELAREEAAREAPEPLDLAEVVETAIARVRIRAPAVSFRTDLWPVQVEGRPGELERMVLNVLDNAAKWSPPGGEVHTRLRAEGPGLGVLTVADGGPGIDPGDLPHVFDRFYRAPAARGTPGSGLGLAIVAQTTAQHGGTVTAGPNSPNGTVVTVHLPCLPPHPDLLPVS